MSPQIYTSNLEPDGWDWREEPYREDPFTKRAICRKCWDGEHSTVEQSDSQFTSCGDSGCDCGCRQSVHEMRAERSAKMQRTKARQKLMREQLEDPANALAAVNPQFTPKSRAHA